MARKVRQRIERGLRVSAYLPADVGARLVELEASTGETRSHLVRRAIERMIESEVASPAPSTQLQSPERSEVLVTHPRIQSLMEQVRNAGANAGQLEEALALTQALLYDTLNRIADQADALERWQQLMVDEDLPRMLTDPAALVPLIDTWRKLQLAIHKIRLVDAMTASEVVGLLERLGLGARNALEIAAEEVGIAPRQRGELVGRFEELAAERARSILPR